MTTLFYAFGILFIIWKFMKLIEPKILQNIFEESSKMKKKFDNGEITKEEYQEFFKENIGTAIFGCIIILFVSLPYLGWIITGIVMSSQWMLFTILIAMSLIHTVIFNLLKRVEAEDWIEKLVSRIVDGVTIILLIYILQNYFLQ